MEALKRDNLKHEHFVEQNGYVNYSASKCNEIINYSQENFIQDLADLKKICDDIVKLLIGDGMELIHA